MRFWLFSFLVGAIASSLSTLRIEQPVLTKQVDDGSAPQAMSSEELAALGDPMFLLVLGDHPDATGLDEVEGLILGKEGQRHLFVVDERLQDPASGQSRRSVIMYRGDNGQSRLDPNIALSVTFNDQRFLPSIEAWGWDDGRSRYNYYKLDGQPLTWKFRGNSIGADRLSPAQRAGTCMACHVNGAPLMKELPIPWNNWHSFRNLVPYLSPASAGRWAIANTPRLADLRGAEDLEVRFILPSIRQFNGRRVNEALQVPPPGGDGLATVGDARRVLAPLFRTTEYNIASAQQPSGLHPLPKAGSGPSAPVSVPGTFFLNANLLAGGGQTQYAGLGIPEALEFAMLLRLSPAEYRSVVSKANTRLGGTAGDANFAWFVPEPSHVDNHIVDLLIRQGVITLDFAAAVLSVDIENPVFSRAREGLLSVIPQSFKFRSLSLGGVPAAHPDSLTREVISRLQALGPPAGSAERELLTALQDSSPVSVLRSKVTGYLQRTRARLAGSQRQSEIQRLYGVMLRRRTEAAAANPALIESSLLFPAGSTP